MKIDLAGIVDQIPLKNDPEGRRRFPEITEAMKAFVRKHP